MCKFLEGKGEIGIFDATNSTFERREFIRKYVHTNLVNY